MVQGPRAWFLANVPSVMVFDDHEMVDDWNISQAWMERAETWRWWPDHVRDGLVAYWLYQHLGNLSPATIRAEGLLAELGTVADGVEVMSRWAKRATLTSAGVHEERFSVVRDVGRVRLVVIDPRNSRVLAAAARRIVDDAEFNWIARQCDADVDHLLIASSLPVFVPRGLHDLQIWNELVCAGRWGRLASRFGEWLRVKADMEDWPSFAASFDRFVGLLTDVGSTARPHPPATISVLSGDIHFSYAAEVHIAGAPMASKVHQLVNSPIRNSLTGPERTAMRLGKSRVAGGLGHVLRRAAGRRRTRRLVDRPRPGVRQLHRRADVRRRPGRPLREPHDAVRRRHRSATHRGDRRGPDARLVRPPVTPRVTTPAPDIRPRFAFLADRRCQGTDTPAA